MKTFMNGHRRRITPMAAVASPVVSLGTEYPDGQQEPPSRGELYDWEDECGRPAGTDATATVS